MVTRPKGIKKSGGRKKGIPNKATQEIRELVQNIVDWEALVLSIQERAMGPDGSDTAARTLFEYGWGRPKEMPEGNGVSEAELISAIKGIARAFMENTGQSVAAPGDYEVQGVEGAL